MFRAYDPERERLVAVKLFTLDLPPERAHQLVAEFERLIAADLAHPALAAPLATGIRDVSAYLVQEYVAAESLDLAVREYGAAPAADALRVAAQLAGALDSAAAAHITHGALHPRDVLLSSDDMRLTGLGVARALERIGVAAPVRRPYTAPERIGAGEWDRRADVFSLAALIHELLWARRVSGTGAQAAGCLTEIAGADLPALREVFARALAEDPAERYETALDFAHALRHACPGVVVAPAPAPAPKRRAVREEEPRLPLEAEEEVFAAEEQRYQDVEVAPAIITPEVDPVIERDNPQVAIPAGLITSYEPEPLSALERSRSAVWPLALALIVGLAIGYAFGYGVGTRERPAPIAAAAAPPASPAAPVPAGREFTESAVAPPSPAPTAPSPAPSPKSEVAKKSEVSNLNSAIPGGRVLVRTTPAGALVSVDGREYGRTPVAVRGLARGAHRMRIARDGYATAERRVVITAKRPSQSMTVALARLRAGAQPRPTQAPATTGGRYTGALAVDSRPTGAKVYVDGKLVGTTPVALPTVAAGSHVIRLEHDGYRRWSSSVRVVASEQNRVTASLER